MAAIRAEINLEIQESIWASLITELEDDCKSPSPTPIDDVDPNPSIISPGADVRDLSMPMPIVDHGHVHGSGSQEAGGDQEKELRASSSSFAAGFGIPSTAAPPLIFSIGSSSSVNSLSTKHNISTWGNHIWDNATLKGVGSSGSGRGRGFSRPRRPFPIGGLTTGAGAALKSPFPMPLDIQMSQRQHQPALALPASISLSGWIDYHKNSKSQGTSSGGGSLGRTNTNGPSLRGRPNNKIDEEYLKSGVRIALSLTVKVKEIRKQQQLNKQMNVCLENVMVVDTAEGLCDLTTSSTMGVSTTSSSEPSLIFALGKLFYAIFSQGSKLPESESEALTCTSGKSKGSGRRGQLNLSRNNTRGSNNSNDAVMMSQQQDDEEEDEETLRKQRRRRRDTNNPRVDITTSLERHKVPYSIIRLLTDMLANTPTSSELMGASLTPDNAITSLDDVECDLRQMNTLPKRFLFDSLLMRFKPVIQDKLYCREKEMKSALGVAERVFCSRGGELNELQDDVGGVNQEVLMLIGDAGSGKSRIVLELTSILEAKKGWRCLHCKFDRFSTRPLSFIIMAFDRFFRRLLEAASPRLLRKLSSGSGSSSRSDSWRGLLVDDCSIVDDVQDGTNAQEELKKIRKHILEVFGQNENMTTICHLIPTLRLIVSDEHISKDPSSHPSPDDEINDPQVGRADVVGPLQNDSEASKCRLHHLFGLLLQTISHDKPLLLFFDDLHFSDQASFDLIVALIRQQVNEESNVLFLGSYRPTEVSDQLDATLCQIKSLTEVTLSDIAVDGLSSDDVNVIVSEALSYPQRLTQSLSKLIHQKSAGNPLYTKELLHDLCLENLLNYSLSSKQWEWDEEVIQQRSVSYDVAELLTRRLLRLPTSSMKSLQIISIFGSEVTLQVLEIIRDVCGITDITTELDHPASEGLIKIDEEACRFVHDLIEHSVRVGIKPDERQSMLKEVSEKLLLKTSDDRHDDILFIIVGLVNSMDVGGASAVDRLNYANLNLRAGEKAIQTPDYDTACKYLECGLSYLGEDSWLSSYNLSLHLHRNAGFVQQARGKTEQMKNHVDQVLEHARCFEDKLDSMRVLISYYQLDANSVAKSFEQCFFVLEQLGETFPKVPERDIIGTKLLEVKTLLDQYIPSSLCKIPPMVNQQKIHAMNFLLGLAISSYQLKSPFFPLLACRMVKLTLNYGMHESSACGLTFYAMSFLTAFEDISEGYRFGKFAMACCTKRNMPSCYFALYGGVNIWKEPLQSCLPELYRAHKEGMAGNIMFGLVNSMIYVYRAFFSGSTLMALSRETSSFLQLYSLYQRRTFIIAITPISNAMASLVGEDNPLIKKYTHGNADSEQILAMSLAVKEITVAETVVVCQLMISFIFRDMVNAEKVAKKHLPFFDAQAGGTLQFINIYRYFYGGLIAFDLIRTKETQDPYWLEFGLRAIKNFKAWTSECEWNFENCYLLLQAEHHFTMGNVDDARSMYKLAIESAKVHRFIHEEAVSCELASIFHNTLGEQEQSKLLLKRATECYDCWGAPAKADALRNGAI